MSDTFHSLYYQVQIDKSRGWFFVGVLRSFENIAFDRTIQKESALFEIFVAPDLELEFLDIMQRLQNCDVVIDVQKLLKSN